MRSSRTVPRYGALFAWLLAGMLSQAGAQEPAGTSRGINIEPNARPEFMVRVGVDHANATYEVGELMQVTVSSEKDGYLYLIYRDAANNLSCLFPNKYQSNNAIKAGNPSVVVPGPAGGFRLRVNPPLGKEVLTAVVALEPLKELDLAKLTKGAKAIAPLTAKSLKGVEVELAGIPSGSWAEHSIEVLTVGQGNVPPQKGNRVGLFVGITKYQDPKVPELTICDRDAQGMCDVMRQSCGLSQTQVLTNDQATAQAIGDWISNKLPQATNPGDIVVIYWSGHGGRCADVHGHHADGQDEYLVPYDGSLADPRKSMVLDDTFGRWLQNLEGRRVVVILDTCHSGGQSEQGRKAVDAMKKSIKAGKKVSFKGIGKSTWGMHFMQNVRRSKDIGHKDMALLASSTASQVSFERKEGDYSVMTYFLLECLKNASGPVTLPDAHNAIKDQVFNYVKREFPGAEQTPVLVDYITPPMYLRGQ